MWSAKRRPCLTANAVERLWNTTYLNWSHKKKVYGLICKISSQMKTRLCFVVVIKYMKLSSKYITRKVKTPCDIFWWEPQGGLDLAPYCMNQVVSEDSSKAWCTAANACRIIMQRKELTVFCRKIILIMPLLLKLLLKFYWCGMVFSTNKSAFLLVFWNSTHALSITHA